MGKIYETVEIQLVLLFEDVVRTSQNDNVSDMPEFPENFGQ